jgi:hypothetical protein
VTLAATEPVYVLDAFAGLHIELGDGVSVTTGTLMFSEIINLFVDEQFNGVVTRTV